MISLEAPNSLAFIGHTCTPSLAPTVDELQSRYIAQLYKGIIKLPSQSEMRQSVDDHLQWIATTRHNKEDASPVKTVPYMDWLAQQIGCDVQSHLTPGLLQRNRRLYNYISKGVLSGHQYPYGRLVFVTECRDLGTWSLGRGG